MPLYRQQGILRIYSERRIAEILNEISKAVHSTPRSPPIFFLALLLKTVVDKNRIANVAGKEGGSEEISSRRPNVLVVVPSMCPQFDADEAVVEGDFSLGSGGYVNPWDLDQ